MAENYYGFKYTYRCIPYFHKSKTIEEVIECVSVDFIAAMNWCYNEELDVLLNVFLLKSQGKPLVVISHNNYTPSTFGTLEHQITMIYKDEAPIDRNNKKQVREIADKVVIDIKKHAPKVRLLEIFKRFRYDVRSKQFFYNTGKLRNTVAPIDKVINFIEKRFAVAIGDELDWDSYTYLKTEEIVKAIIAEETKHFQTGNQK